LRTSQGEIRKFEPVDIESLLEIDRNFSRLQFQLPSYLRSSFVSRWPLDYYRKLVMLGWDELQPLDFVIAVSFMAAVLDVKIGDRRDKEVREELDNILRYVLHELDPDSEKEIYEYVYEIANLIRPLKRG